jgi:hypothetical protein
MSCDVARGAGHDYSAFSMIDITDVPYKLVARYRNNNISPLLYPNVIHKTATDYNTAWVLVEANDIGGQVADTLYYDLEYENLISSIVKGRAGQVVSAGFGRDNIFGIKTTAQVKRIGCQSLKTLIEESQLLILDFDTVAELTSFAVKGKSYQATEGNHDDLVMTLVLFSWMTTQRYFKDLLDQDLRVKLFEEKMRQLEEEVLPIGFLDDGLEQDIFIDSEGDRWTVVAEYDNIHSAL